MACPTFGVLYCDYGWPAAVDVHATFTDGAVGPLRPFIAAGTDIGLTYFRVTKTTAALGTARGSTLPKGSQTNIHPVFMSDIEYP